MVDMMNDWSLIAMVIIAFLTIFIVSKYSVDNLKLLMENSDLKRLNQSMKSNYDKLKSNMDECLKIKFADENIMYYTRCINDPRKKVCKDTNDNKGICRARFQDCNKMRGIIENDPVAVYRMKLLNEGI